MGGHKMGGHICILGGDGYLGWPSAMRFSALGYDVTVVDNYLRRALCARHGLDFLYPVPRLAERTALWEELGGRRIRFVELDLAEPENMRALFDATDYERLCGPRPCCIMRNSLPRRFRNGITVAQT